MSSVDPKASSAVSYPELPIPAGGEIVEVAAGVYWVRMPLPFALDHINLWLLKDGDSWVQVDTGLVESSVIEYWRTIFESYLGGAPVTRLIVTHLHPDHVGLAGWLTHEWGATLHMSRTEYLLCRTLLSDTHKEVPEAAINFYRHAGFDEEAIGIYRAHFGGYGSFVGALPDAYQRLVNGDKLKIDGVDWEVIIGQGHSPEHVCLYCAEKKVFIAGDQLLPTISSNVSVWPIEPNANPLKDWIESCHLLRARLPADILVLPAHGKPFYGAHPRLDSLIAEHEQALNDLYEVCAEPKRVVDVFPVLFKNPVTKRTLIFATGEARAHLNYLVQAGRLQMDLDEKGVGYYRQVS
ncbi:MBL fold metallo-hydrolase [uncultured Thiothrix sp.]|uniref:MBL fold metallo-hydrolase n=1 Tax=uncultured Thiothrix sp. TaxID=223185 RepID=UPI0026135CDF|nr:MBL fold metallo-hydrolase [uncultured Thiothrix sp.]